MSDWRDKVENKYEKVESFKLKQGSATVRFIDEGWPWFSQADNKDYIIFKVQKEGDIIRPFFVNAKNHPFLLKIKALGSLKGRLVTLTRTGERKATRWDVSPVEE